MPKRLRRLMLAVSVALAAFYVALAGLIAVAVLGQGAYNRANGLCMRAQPADAWGFTIEWRRSDLTFICSYQGRDYRPTGDDLRVGLRDLL